MFKNILLIAGFGVVLVTLVAFFLVNSEMNSNNSTNSKNLNNSNSQNTLQANSQTNSQNNSPQNNENNAKIGDQKASQKITNAEFTKHFSKSDCWVSFENKVYDVTTFLAIHPGGSSKLARFCSKKIDPVSINHPGGLFGSSEIQVILTPFYVGELVE